MHHLARILACSLPCVIAYGQRPVLTVGGVSPQYFDLPAAVAAAAPGSIIECRPGVYTGFVTSKALRIVGNNVTVQPPAGADYAIEIHDISGGVDFAIRGVDFAVVAGAMGAVCVRDSSAPVILESVNLYSLFGQPGLDVSNTGTVHVSRSILVGSPGARVHLANFVSSENVVGSAAGVGALITNSLFESIRTIYVGTDAAALRIIDGDARLSSDGSGAMIVLGAPPGPVSAVELFDSLAQFDPTRFQLLPANGAALVSEVNSTKVLEEVPCLTAGPAVLGQTATARVTAGTPVAGLIAISYLRPVPLVLASTGIHIQLPPALLAAGGVVDQVGLTFQFDLPADPSLRGELFAFQAITLPASGAAQLSGPALWYLY